MGAWWIAIGLRVGRSMNGRRVREGGAAMAKGTAQPANMVGHAQDDGDSDSSDVPDEFRCPITFKRMKRPVSPLATLLTVSQSVKTLHEESDVVMPACGIDAPSHTAPFCLPLDAPPTNSNPAVPC
jgi:hypothetical protein